MPGQQRDAIESPGAWLTTVASRICLTAHPNYILAGETDERLFTVAGMAGSAVLHRCRARRTGPDRSRHPAQRHAGRLHDELRNRGRHPLIIIDEVAH